MLPALVSSRYRILFVLAYAAIAGLALFAHPFADADPAATQSAPPLSIVR